MDGETEKKRRLAVLASHLTRNNVLAGGHVAVQPHGQGMVAYDSLNQWLVRDNRELREAIFDFLNDPLYMPNYQQSLEGFRELTMQRAALESLSFCDYSMAIKSGVHFTLCGGTIVKLGTEKHHKEFLPKMDTLELPGCFGMTELGHGSNVMGIETTANMTERVGCL
eukprot:jgi/Picre1/29986/NNA_005362.t1